jgi:hypothetical protein
VKSGRYRLIGSSRSTSPRCTASTSIVAVTSFEVDCTLKRVDDEIAAPPERRVVPYPPVQRIRSASQIPIARPGTSSRRNDSGIRLAPRPDQLVHVR